MSILVSLDENLRINETEISTLIIYLFAKICKLYNFATCNSNFKKSRLSEMHYSLTDIPAYFEINRPVRYRSTAKKNYYHRLTDEQTAQPILIS